MFISKRILILLCAFVLTACSGGAPSFPSVFASATSVPPTSTPLPPSETPVPMAITVNADGIPVVEFNAELARYKAAQTAMGNTVSDADALQIVREDLISQLLLTQGAAENGFTMDDSALQQRIDKLISEIGGADKLTAWEQAHGYSDESFRVALKRAAASAWMRDKIISSVPSTTEQVHVRQILLYNEDVANNYYNQLQAGADFDQLATQVDPVTRGDIGWFPRGYLAEKAVEDAAFSLEVGKYSAVIPGEVGFHIIKTLEIQADRPLSPDALLALQNRVLSEWLASRRQQSSIVLAP
jgi:parvulin-like peptidyl-prolyl isomerase